MRPTVKMEGKTFGRLTCLSPLRHKESKHIFWLCQCSCGNQSTVKGTSLRDGTTRSCGCWAIERTKKRNTKHGQCGTYYYWLWRHIKSRCNNPNHHAYHRYGGRGIKIHPLWERDFKKFYKYLIKNLGERPSEKFSLDRTDNSKGYIPGNVRWATSSLQCYNRDSYPHPWKTKDGSRNRASHP